MPHSNHNSDMKTNNIMVTLRTIGIGLLLLCVNVRAFADDKKGDEETQQNTINFLRTRRRKLQVVSLSLYIRVMGNSTWRFLSNTCIKRCCWVVVSPQQQTLPI